MELDLLLGEACVIKIGDTFLAMPSRTGQMHLTFVIATLDRPYEVQRLIVVNASTSNTEGDMSCLLSPNDADAHPWIRHDSFIYYKMMTDMTECVLAAYDARQPASHHLLMRIQRGALLSPHTPRQYVNSIKLVAQHS